MKKTNIIVMVAMIIALASITNKSNAQWGLTGNTIAGTNFLGSTNNFSLRLRTNNAQRMLIDSLGRVGIGAGFTGTSFPGDMVDIFDGTNHAMIGGNQIRFSRTGAPSYITATGLGSYLDFVTNGRVPSHDSSNLVLRPDLGSYFTGNVGIGVWGAQAKLSVDKTGLDDIMQLSDDGNSLTVGTDSDLPTFIRIRPTSGTGLAITNNGDDVGLFVKSDASANVGIGTSSPDQKLVVAGTMRADAIRINTTIGATGYVASIGGKLIAEEIRIATQANWPDYVFDKSHILMPIEEVESHIERNKHLPGIPSACDVEENGIMVGEMQAKTIEKVEELTLYIIQLKKENKELAKRLEALEKR